MNWQACGWDQTMRCETNIRLFSSNQDLVQSRYRAPRLELKITKVIAVYYISLIVYPQRYIPVINSKYCSIYRG